MGATLDRWNRICLESAHARMHQVGPCPNCVESMASDCDEAKTLNAELVEAVEHLKVGAYLVDCKDCQRAIEVLAKAKGGEA